MTEHHDLEEIRNLPSAELIELLPAVDPEKLAALRGAEVADADARPDVIEAIDKAIAALPPVGEKTDTEKAVAATQQTAAQKKAAQAAEKATAAARAKEEAAAKRRVEQETNQAAAAERAKKQAADRAAADEVAASARVGAQHRDDAEAGAAAKTEPAPAWQAENYDGPITIPQAEWRRANLKPARAVREK